MWLLPNNRTLFIHKRCILVGVNRSNNSMQKGDHCSEDTKSPKSPKTISQIQNGSRADNVDIKTRSLQWTHVLRG